MANSPNPHVAKCLYKSKKLSGSNAISENIEELEFEAKHTSYAKYFLDWFFKVAKEQGVEMQTSKFSLIISIYELGSVQVFILAPPLDITPLRLAKEVRDMADDTDNIHLNLPSPASGVSNDDGNEVHWLIEPGRPNTFKKWSGTNVHNHLVLVGNKVGDVLNVFVHFVYQISKKEMVVVDLQSMFLLTHRVINELTLFLQLHLERTLQESHPRFCLTFALIQKVGISTCISHL